MYEIFMILGQILLFASLIYSSIIFFERERTVLSKTIIFLFFISLYTFCFGTIRNVINDFFDIHNHDELVYIIGMILFLAIGKFVDTVVDIYKYEGLGDVKEIKYGWITRIKQIKRNSMDLLKQNSIYLTSKSAIILYIICFFISLVFSVFIEIALNNVYISHNVSSIRPFIIFCTILLFCIFLIVIPFISKIKQNKETIHDQYTKKYQNYESSSEVGQEEQIRQEEQPPRFTANELRYFEILGVEPGASFAEIKKGYHKRCMHYHPDTVAHLGEEFKRIAGEKMQAINEAYSYFENKFK